MKHKGITGICLVLILLTLSCKRQEKVPSPAVEQRTEELKEFPAGFMDFYERFHTDSVYQIEHINFPLPGLPAHVDSTQNYDYFRWQQKDWKMMHLLAPDEQEFQQSFYVPYDQVVIDYIYTTGGAFLMERRFAASGSDWRLIYYWELHPTGNFKFSPQQ